MDKPTRLQRFISSIAVCVVINAVVGAALAATVPSQMQAVVQHGSGGPDVLKLEQVPVPTPAAGQVLVHIYAAGVNPFDWKMRTGMMPGGPPRERPGNAAAPAPTLIPGGDIAGVIAALGPGVTSLKVGQSVYGSVMGVGAGYAQYSLADVNAIASKPKTLTYAQAAGLPVALVALREMRDGNVQAGQSVVIVGAAGGVGSAAVQLAKARGAKVITVASSEHNAYLKQLGADQLVNYDKTNPSGQIKDVDVVINMVEGQESSQLGWVRRGGRLVSIVGTVPDTQCAAAGVTCPQEMARGPSQGPTTAQQLAELNELINKGTFTVRVEKTFRLAQAGEAQEFNRAGHAEGKVVLVTTSLANQR